MFRWKENMVLNCTLSSLIKRSHLPQLTLLGPQQPPQAAESRWGQDPRATETGQGRHGRPHLDPTSHGDPTTDLPLGARTLLSPKCTCKARSF